VYIGVLDSLFVANSSSISVELEVGAIWRCGISFGFFGMSRYWTVRQLVRVVMSDHGLVWETSRGRALVGLYSDSPFLVTGTAV
jgi:hypothetical protein